MSQPNHTSPTAGSQFPADSPRRQELLAALRAEHQRRNPAGPVPAELDMLLRAAVTFKIADEQAGVNVDLDRWARVAVEAVLEEAAR